MYIKNKFILSCLFLLTLGMASCSHLEEEDKSYQGPTLVEFKNHTLGMIASEHAAPFGLDFRGILSTTSTPQTDSTRFVSVVGYTIPATVSATGTVTALARNIRPRTADTVLVQLVGPQRSNATQVRFETFDASVRNSAGAVTTANAVEGRDFNFDPSGAKTVTIPANSSQGFIIIKPIASGFTGTERKRLGLRLLGADDAAANPNYDTFYVTMTRTQ